MGWGKLLLSWCTSEEKSSVLPLTLDSRKFSPVHWFLLFNKEVRLWIKDLFCHLMDLNWVYLVQLGCEFTADSVMNSWNSSLIHPLALSPFTEHWLYTYCAPDTVQTGGRRPCQIILDAYSWKNRSLRSPQEDTQSVNQGILVLRSACRLGVHSYFSEAFKETSADFTGG